MKKKLRLNADRTPIRDPLLKSDPMRNTLPRPNDFRPVSFDAGVGVPSDLAALYAYIEAEIDELHRAGGLDQGTWEVQDEFIAALIAPWYAARWDEYRRSVHAAEDLHNQAEANVAEITINIGSLLDEIERLQKATDAARRIVAGRSHTTTTFTERATSVTELLGSRGIENAPRVESPATDATRTRPAAEPITHPTALPKENAS